MIPQDNFDCPRRLYEFGPWDHEENKSEKWREDYTCSFCGGINPDKVIELIKKGYRVSRTDKNYKIYIETPYGMNREDSQLPNKQSMWKVYIMHFSKEQINNLNKALGLI